MSNSFQYIVDRVSQLKPGQSCTISRDVIEPPKASAIAAFLEMATGGFTQADRVLENVVGSSVTHYYRREAHGIRYCRLHAELPEGVRGYVSPDRSHCFRQRADGLYEHVNGEKLTDADERRILCALHDHAWGPGLCIPVRDVSARLYPITAVSNATIQLQACERCQRCPAARDLPEIS